MPKLGSQDLQGLFCDVCGFEHSMSEVENFSSVESFLVDLKEKPG